MASQNYWLEYEWSVRKDPAFFCVNAEYAEERPDGYDALLYCAVAPDESGVLFFTAKEIRRLSRIEAKLNKALGDAIYVGYIHMDALRQYYFYVKDMDAALEAVENLANSQKKFCLTPGVTEEADWLTYYALLMPDAAKYQTILNGQLIDRQRSAGDALEKVRRISFFVCFPSDQQRQMFIEDARQAGFAIGDAIFQQELALSHVQTLYFISSLDKRDVDELTTRVINIAKPYDGEFLRWTCPKMLHKSPLA